MLRQLTALGTLSALASVPLFNFSPHELEAHAGQELAWAYFDGDGSADLFTVDDAGRGALHRGDGLGGFVEVTLEQQLGSLPRLLSALWADADGDGWSDLVLETALEVAERIRAIAPSEANRPVFARHALISLALAHLDRQDWEAALRSIERIDLITDEAQMISALNALHQAYAALAKQGGEERALRATDALVQRSRAAGFRVSSDFLTALPPFQRASFVDGE